jgi:hypothetical protein
MRMVDDIQLTKYAKSNNKTYTIMQKFNYKQFKTMYEYYGEMFQANKQKFFELLSDVVVYIKHNLNVQLTP